MAAKATTYGERFVHIKQFNNFIYSSLLYITIRSIIHPSKKKKKTEDKRENTQQIITQLIKKIAKIRDFFYCVFK